MNRKVGSIWIVSLLMIISFTGLMLFTDIKEVSASPDPAHEDANQGGTGIAEFFGDWYVDAMDNLIYKNQTIILNGNLQINDTGSLTFFNITLKMNCTGDGQYHIDVKSGGSYYIYDYDGDNTTPDDASIIRNGTTHNHFLFWIRSGVSFEMKNSELHECGWDMNNKGLIIDSDNILIDKCTFSNNYVGFSFNYSSNNIITNNFIVNNYNGIILDVSSFNLLQNNEIIVDNDALSLLGGSNNNTICNNTLSDSGVSGLNYGIDMDYSDNNTIENNIIKDFFYGIYLRYSDNTYIFNNSIYSCDYGVMLSRSIYNNLENNAISCRYYSVYINTYCEYNIVANNTLSAAEGPFSWAGVYIYGYVTSPTASCRYNEIINNTIIGNYTWWGIYSHYGDYTTITNNIVTSNLRGLYITRSMYNYIAYNEITDNSDHGIMTNTYAINNNISNNFIALNGDCGIKTDESTSWCEIYNNTIIKNMNYGLYLGNSNTHDTNILHNKFSNPNINVYSVTSNDIVFDYNYYGDYVGIDNGSGGNIAGDGIGDTDLPYATKGISCHDYHPRTIITRSSTVDTYAMIQTAINNSIDGNDIYVPEGIYYENLIVNESYGNCDLNIIGAKKDHTIIHGKWLDDCIRISGDYEVGLDSLTFSNGIKGVNYQINNKNCTLVDSKVIQNDIGIYINLSTNKAIINNNISLNNQYGFYLTGAINNEIYHNNIIDNGNQSYDDSDDGNKWDNGYPSGGNYWSDYDGIDLNRTPSQDVPPPDGIGDTPYIIDSDSKDNYPLIDPWEYRIFLFEGWNLISIPFIQSDNNLSTILNPINGFYDAVQWYNTNDISDHWKHNQNSKPTIMNDLKNINHMMGFWIHITGSSGALFEYQGTQPTVNPTIQLYEGWNMVGYPSLSNHNRTIGLNNLTFGTDVNAVQWYDAATQTWHDMGPDDVFVPGRGYWVHANVECEWEVPL